MKRIQFIIILFAVLVSCNDEWLKPDPLSFYAPENVFVDEKGFVSGLITLRKNLQYDFTGEKNPISMDHVFSDLAVATFQADFQAASPSRSTQWPKLLDLFNKAYEFIKNANVIISRIDDISWADSKVRDKILYEAYWHRAYWYYRLVNTYGDVPWVGTEVASAKIDFYSTSRWAILKQIQKDLEDAVGALPEKPGTLGDVTKGAVQHLLVKVYLANTEFDKAITTATALIDGPYALMTSRFGVDATKSVRNLLWDLHRPDNKNAPENTEVIYSVIDRPDAPATAWAAGWGLSNPGENDRGAQNMRNYCPAYWKVPAEGVARATDWSYAPPGSPEGYVKSGDTLGIGNANVRTNDYFHYTLWEDDQYTWETTPDLRRADINWIEMGESISEITVAEITSPEFGQPLKRGNITLTNNPDMWYSWPFYKTYIPTPNERQPRGGQSDLYVFRLAETYLLRAEAYYWKSNTEAAVADINQVRRRANAPEITAADVDLDYIYDERARELYTEEPRHAEMVRVSFIMAKLGLEGYNLENFSKKNWFYDRVMKVNYFYEIDPATGNPRFFHYSLYARMEPYNVLYPVPESVITSNTQGTINQNEGYPGAESNIPPLSEIE